MRITLAALLLSACVGGGSGDSNELPACSADVTLDGSTLVGTQQMIGFDVIDAEGSSVCLHLDATNNTVGAYFTVRSNFWDGPTPFAMSLHDMNGALLLQGEDSSIPNTDGPLTQQELSWITWGHDVIDVMLWVRAPDGANRPTFRLALSNPEPNY